MHVERPLVAAAIGTPDDRSLLGDGIVGATLVVALYGLPTPAFVGTGRRKGVPYEGRAVVLC